MAPNVNYDRAAAEYAAHRQIHGGVFQELCRRPGLGTGTVVLEVGCGSGNYTRALTENLSCMAYGLDPSAGMLTQARLQGGGRAWLLGRAELLPFAGQAFDLIFSVDVIHHVADKAAFYQQVVRTLRPGGYVCTVTDSEDIIRRREILSGYFPETVEIELARYPRLAQVQAWMAQAELRDLEISTVEEPYELMSAQPFRDRAYSSLHLIAKEAWLAGLARLERDLACGPIQGVSRYACIWGRKAGS
jgi:ubiquinone/menaquinone biosynthesis C-methylase UbiE